MHFQVVQSICTKCLLIFLIEEIKKLRNLYASSKSSSVKLGSNWGDNATKELATNLFHCIIYRLNNRFPVATGGNRFVVNLFCRVIALSPQWKASFNCLTHSNDCENDTHQVIFRCYDAIKALWSYWPSFNLCLSSYAFKRFWK